LYYINYGGGLLGRFSQLAPGMRPNSGVRWLQLGKRRTDFDGVARVWVNARKATTWQMLYFGFILLMGL
jgi:hypothetical protein